jgi:hypothetical protein
MEWQLLTQFAIRFPRHVLITSRGFDARRDVGALLRVVQFIREEASGAGAAPSGGGQAEMSTQTVARFAMCRKELVLVAEPQDGLRRLAEKLDGLWVDYCRLRQLPVRRETAASPAAAANAALPFELEALMDGTKLVFYSCGVEDLGQFARTRHESIRQLGSAFRVRSGAKPVGIMGFLSIDNARWHLYQETTYVIIAHYTFYLLIKGLLSPFQPPVPWIADNFTCKYLFSEFMPAKRRPRQPQWTSCETH